MELKLGDECVWCMQFNMPPYGQDLFNEDPIERSITILKGSSKNQLKNRYTS